MGGGGAGDGGAFDNGDVDARGGAESNLGDYGGVNSDRGVMAVGANDTELAVAGFSPAIGEVGGVEGAGVGAAGGNLS